MALAPEKITELKQIIHNHLSQRDVQSHIRNTVSEFMREEQPGRLGRVREEDFMQRLRQKGVVDEIMRQLQFDDGRGTSKPATHGLNQDEKLSLTNVNKAVKKKCSASGRKKGHDIMQKWIKSITNHLWYCCSACNGDAEELKRLWHSILHHVVGVHQWEDEDGTKRSCNHPPLSPEEQEIKIWFDPTSTVYRDLTSIVMDRRLSNDLEQLALFKHTSGLEVYHSLMLKFAPKRTHFHYPAMKGRMQLAVLDHNHNTGRQVATTHTGNIDPTRRYLYFQVLGGKAFLDHLQEPEPLPGQSATTFTLHVHFRGQRLMSRPVPVACEPAINEGFLLELHKDTAGEAARMADPTAMLSICDPIHLVLVRTNGSGETTLVSSHFHEWRPVLASPDVRSTTTVELLGTCSENKVPVGILEVQVELFPKTQQVIGQDVVRAQINLEKGRQAEKERLFLVYAKQWWKEYLQIRPSHQERLVKIFAQDENATNRPVCSFVKPLRAGRLLDTSRQAARFVNLIDHEKVQSVGGGEAKEQWTTMHAFLCRNKGGCEDHALLLCSLLLGFGLDAYVCVGTKAKSSVHAWVMTLSSDGLVTFWESLNGHRYIHDPVDPDEAPMGKQCRPKYPYRTIGCVFNHQNFYANCQPSDAVEVCEFELDDQARWKAMSQDAVLSVCGPGAVPQWPSFPPLCASRLDGSLVSNDLEQQLRILVSTHRQDIELTTVWDDQLSYLLTPALAAYEMERVTGIAAGNEEFQDSIRRAVPDGHTFKGYPIQFSHRNARRAFAACLRSPVCEEILNCRGDHIRLAVRVRVFTYPESVCATWLMFACKFKSVL